MQKSFWWRQYSDRYKISVSPHLHTPPPPHLHFSPSVISRMVSVDVKHLVYYLNFRTTPHAGQTHYCKTLQCSKRHHILCQPRSSRSVSVSVACQCRPCFKFILNVVNNCKPPWPLLRTGGLAYKSKSLSLFWAILNTVTVKKKKKKKKKPPPPLFSFSFFTQRLLSAHKARFVNLSQSYYFQIFFISITVFKKNIYIFILFIFYTQRLHSAHGRRSGIPHESLPFPSVAEPFSSPWKQRQWPGSGVADADADEPEQQRCTDTSSSRWGLSRKVVRSARSRKKGLRWWVWGTR